MNTEDAIFDLTLLANRYKWLNYIGEVADDMFEKGIADKFINDWIELQLEEAG
jgi:hypothetical protein